MDITQKGNWHIVTTPTYDWLADCAKACRSQVLICSPYVNGGILSLTNLIPTKVSRTLITRTDLRDFAVGASNLDTLCTLAEGGMSIHTLSRLHAKVYIFDDSTALITSANATYSGLHRNLECGIGTDDSAVVKQLTQSLFAGLGSDTPPYPMDVSELQALREPLKAIKANVPKQPPRDDSTKHETDDDVDAEFSIPDKDALLDGFGGWQKLTLRGVLDMPEDGFGINELHAACAPVASIEYPNNHNVHAKLRQQLQMLRDLGLVEFVATGQYKRTMS